MANQKLSDDLQSILDAVNSEHGSDALMTMEGTSGLWPMDKRMPTGSIELDMAIGIGGWSRGKLHMIVGEESSGKTTLALITAALAQARGERVVYIDAESALNPEWMGKLGVDLSSTLIAQPNSLENAIDTSVTAMQTGKVDLLIYDSIPALKARLVMEGEAEQETRALEARRWSSQVPKIVLAAKEHNVTVIFINQMRDSMSMYVAESYPGGRTLKYAMSTIVKLKKYLEGRGNDDGVDYHDANFEIIKNKQGSPYKKGSYTIWTKSDTPFDPVLDSFYSALKFGIIQKGIKWDPDEEELITKNNWFSLEVHPDDTELIELIREHIDEDFDAPAISFYREGPMLEAYKQLPGVEKIVTEKIMSTLDKNAIIHVDSEGQSEAELDALQATEESEEDS